MQDFPGGPVAQTPHFQCREPRFNPWSGNQIPHAPTKDPCATMKTQCSPTNKQKYFYRKKKSDEATEKCDINQQNSKKQKAKWNKYRGKSYPVCMLSCCHVCPFTTPWTAVCQVPLSMNFSRQGYWRGWQEAIRHSDKALREIREHTGNHTKWCWEEKEGQGIREKLSDMGDK